MHRFLAKLRVREAAKHAKELILDQRHEDALARANEAYALAMQHLDSADVDRVLAVSYFAAARFHTGDDQGAITLLESVADDADQVLVGLPEERQALLNNLAVCYHRTGRPQRGISLMKRVIEDKAKTLG